MRIALDTHTHSVASGHAYSTVDDMASGARRAGLAGFVLTDHGPAMPGTTHHYHFGNLRVLPRRIKGVRFFAGVEANILDTEGRLDLDARHLGRLDFVLAGLHEICLQPMDRERNTLALVRALENPFVDAVSHPGNPAFPVDARAVVLAAWANGKAIELNEGSFRVRQGSKPNCLAIARLCAETGTQIVCGTDSHYKDHVGRFPNVKALLKEARVPRELVVNRSLASFEAFLARRAAERLR